jgi:hypothetical protein
MQIVVAIHTLIIGAFGGCDNLDAWVREKVAFKPVGLFCVITPNDNTLVRQVALEWNTLYLSLLELNSQLEKLGLCYHEKEIVTADTWDY